MAILTGIIGAVLGVARLWVLRRVYKLIKFGWQTPTDSPRADIELAFDRLEWIMARQYRPRQSGETRREYMRALQNEGATDDRLQRILDIHERAVYSDEISRVQANEAIEIVNDIVRERLFSRDHWFS